MGIDAVREVVIAGGLIAIGRGLVAVGACLVALTACLGSVGKRLVAVGKRLLVTEPPQRVGAVLILSVDRPVNGLLGQIT